MNRITAKICATKLRKWVLVKFLESRNFSIRYSHTCKPTCFRGGSNVSEMDTFTFRAKTEQD